ncbi:MAG: 4Fe-4S dicluster domain-containing protein [Anaerohalosphaera sp.]|nr:4Fe-4S dicluster domain-containing protein [Anaerohalosphaera sp.]
MKFTGGYNILPDGKPDGRVTVMPEPEALFLPLKSARFHFSELCVKDGESVNGGDTLAKDPDNFDVPLLCPRTGTVSLEEVEGHIVLRDISCKGESVWEADDEEVAHIEQKVGAGGLKRFKMVSLGAWEYFSDAFSGDLPDPLSVPQAIIVSAVSLDPFVVRGDVQLKNNLSRFTRGLEHLQTLLKYQPIYLVLPAVKSDFASKVRDMIRGYAWVSVIEVPVKYPYDNLTLIARKLGLKRSDGPVWGLRAEGVLAVDTALTLTKPCIERIISVGGPGASHATNLKLTVGYPTEAIIKEYCKDKPVVTINGGMLAGSDLADGGRGVTSECRGITFCMEHVDREFLGWLRPGFDRKCYASCFMSAIRIPFSESYSNAVRGEDRPCVSCGFCEDVCPSGIMPYLIHKYLYADLIEEAASARVDLCIQCGLCSFICPSKIELSKEFSDAIDLIEQEKEEERKAAEAEAKRVAEAEAKKASEFEIMES